MAGTDYKLDTEVKGKKTLLYMYGTILDQKPEKNFWTGEPVEMECIYPKQVRDIVQEIKTDEVELHINSNGGSVFASISIGNYLKSTGKKITTVVDGIAASGAAIIAMCGEEVKMNSNSQMMIHNAATFGFGNAKTLRKIADDLEEIDKSVLNTFKARFKGTDEELAELLDGETFMSADKALELGFCDEIITEEKKEEANDDDEVTEDENIEDKITNENKFLNGFVNLINGGIK